MRGEQGNQWWEKHAKVHLCCGFVQLFHVQVSPVSQVLCIQKDALTTICVYLFHWSSADRTSQVSVHWVEVQYSIHMSKKEQMFVITKCQCMRQRVIGVNNWSNLALCISSQLLLSVSVRKAIPATEVSHTEMFLLGGWRYWTCSVTGKSVFHTALSGTENSSHISNHPPPSLSPTTPTHTHQLVLLATCYSNIHPSPSPQLHTHLESKVLVVEVTIVNDGRVEALKRTNSW